MNKVYDLLEPPSYSVLLFGTGVCGTPLVLSPLVWYSIVVLW